MSNYYRGCLYQSEPHRIKLISQFYVRIETGLKTAGYNDLQIKSVLGRIEVCIDNYIEILKSYWTSEDGYLSYLKEGPRKLLLKNIVHSHPLLEKIFDVKTLSALLFGSPQSVSGYFMRTTDVDMRPTVSNLNRISYMISHWNVEAFQKYGITTSRYEIEVARINALNALRDWVFLNPRSTYSQKSQLKWAPYIKEIKQVKGVTYTKDDYLADYELNDLIVNAVAERIRGIPTFDDNTIWTLSQKRISAELDIPRKFGGMIQNGRFYSNEKLEQYYIKFSTWFVNEFGDRALGLEVDHSNPSKLYRYNQYQKVLNGISNYAKIRGLDLFDGSGSFIINGRRYDYQNRLTNDYDQYFNDQAYKNFAVLYHLTKYLGFDPYSFTPQSDADIVNGKFRLHHYLANVFRKMSSHLEDVTLVMDTLHYPSGIYETLKETEIGEAEIRGLLQSITDLIYYKDSLGNPIPSVGRTEIKEVLIKNLGAEKGEDTYLRWTSSSKFTAYLAKFNDHRAHAVNGEFLELLIDKFPDNYKKRFNDAKNFVKSGAFQLKLRSFISTEASLDFLNYLYKLSVKMPTTTQTSLHGIFI